MLKEISDPKQYSWIIHFAIMQLEADPHRSPFPCVLRPPSLFLWRVQLKSSLFTIAFLDPAWVCKAINNLFFSTLGGDDVTVSTQKMIQVNKTNNTRATLDVPNTFPTWVRGSLIHAHCLSKEADAVMLLNQWKHKGLSPVISWKVGLNKKMHGV